MVAIKVEIYQMSLIFASCYKPPQNLKNEPITKETKRLSNTQKKQSYLGYRQDKQIN